MDPRRSSLFFLDAETRRRGDARPAEDVVILIFASPGSIRYKNIVICCSLRALRPSAALRQESFD